MKIGICILFLCFFLIGSLCSQGRVGINTLTPAAMLHVKDSSVIFSSPSGLPGSPAQTPLIGAGNRMMWYAGKAAFRAGGVTGGHWNRDSIGGYSFSAGFNTKALGYASVAIGNLAEARGLSSVSFGHGRAVDDYSTAFGSGVAMGEHSTAMGVGTKSIGDYSTAFGANTQSIGDYSTSFGLTTYAKGEFSTSFGSGTIATGDLSASCGFNTKSKPYASFVLGQYNDTTSISTTFWNTDDPVFIIGNGANNTSRSNALTVLKNAKVGINNSSPDAMLHIQKNGSSGGPLHTSSALIVESDQSAYLQFSNPINVEAGILAGGHNTSIRSGLIFRSDSAVHVRTGGNVSNLIIDKVGRVGMGNVNPGFPLNFPSVVGDKISLFGNSGNHYGFGIQNFLLQIHTSASTEDIAFGYGSSSSFTERMRIKGNGNVGIGTPPLRRLHVSNGSSGASSDSETVALFENDGNAYLQILTPNNSEGALLFGNPANSISGGIYYNAIGSNEMMFTTDLNITRMTISSGGNVGIGTLSPSEKLHVVGDICYTGAIAACSDVRYKKNFRPISNALTSLQLIHGMYYDWNTEAYPDKEFNDERQIGFSAQELEKVYPEVVQTDPDGFKSVDYSRLTPILVEAIKEQQIQIDLLTNELNQLKEMVLEMSKSGNQ